MDAFILHQQVIDNLKAFGLHEDSVKWSKAIRLRHDFYEVDFLPENDRVHFTIHHEASKEVLKLPLPFNRESYEEKIKQGLHNKADVEKFYAKKGKPMPPDTVLADGRVKHKNKAAKLNKTEERRATYRQQSLFGEPEKNANTKQQ